MPGPYGVTATGFNGKTLDEIKTELEGVFRLVFGAGINLEAQSVFAQLIGIIADREVDLWELGADIFGALNVRNATGAALDNLASMRGLTRRAASKTLVTITATGVDTTVIPAGTQFAVTGTNVKFQSLALATISGGTATINLEALDAGPNPAYANTVTVIVNPIAGLSSVNNALDHTLLGDLVESDQKLRERIVLSSTSGSRFISTIRGHLLELPGVTDAYIFENTSSSTVDSVPPHAFEVVIQGGDDTEIAETILEFKPEGIQAYGSTIESVTDSQGFSVDIGFTRPTAKNVYIIANVDVNPALYPVDGDALVEAAIVNFGDNKYRVGSDVYASPIEAAILAAVPGVVNVKTFIGFSVSPSTDTALSVSLRELADLDTSRITVVQNVLESSEL